MPAIHPISARVQWRTSPATNWPEWVNTTRTPVGRGRSSRRLTPPDDRSSRLANAVQTPSQVSVHVTSTRPAQSNRFPRRFSTALIIHLSAETPSLLRVKRPQTLSKHAHSHLPPFPPGSKVHAFNDIHDANLPARRDGWPVSRLADSRPGISLITVKERALAASLAATAIEAQNCPLARLRTPHRTAPNAVSNCRQPALGLRWDSSRPSAATRNTVQSNRELSARYSA